MDYLPLFFNVRNKRCLIVGGAKVAYRKAVLLHQAGACIDVVAPNIDGNLAELATESGGAVFKKKYHYSDLDQALLVIAATDDDATNRQVAADAESRHLLVNVVDTPDVCSVIFPAVIKRDPLLVAVSSSGRAPVLARAIRSQIESSVPANIGQVAEFIGRKRAAIKQLLPEARRRSFWEEFLDSEITERIIAGREEDAEQLFKRYTDRFIDSSQPIGEVYLVGAGPGDPDLLTFKALRLIQRADVVLYDRLVAAEIVDMARRDAERIYVGKSKNVHAVPQQDINRLLVELATSGKKVVRLKGGDPFVFGRGGEEIAELAQNDIPFQIVPGISAANGCACYAGIPLTHRDYAQSVRFVTGHLKDGSMDLPWDELVQDGQTVVIYMGLTGLAYICQQLMAHGRDVSTPVALVERGTTPDQKTHVGTLSTIADMVAQQEVHAPTLIIVGAVVSLQSTLSWYN